MRCSFLEKIKATYGDRADDLRVDLIDSEFDRGTSMSGGDAVFRFEIATGDHELVIWGFGEGLERIFQDKEDENTLRTLRSKPDPRFLPQSRSFQDRLRQRRSMKSRKEA